MGGGADGAAGTDLKVLLSCLILQRGGRVGECAGVVGRRFHRRCEHAANLHSLGGEAGQPSDRALASPPGLDQFTQSLHVAPSLSI